MPERRGAGPGPPGPPQAQAQAAKGQGPGGPGRPAGLPRGFFARPTVFADVPPHAAIYREEIFGPVRAPPSP